MKKQNKNNSVAFFQQYNPSEVTESNRIICTPSSFAKDTLWYIQEIGTLKSLKPHTSQRKDLESYLFMIVLSGSGSVIYDGKKINLRYNDAVFIDCNKKYSHRSSSTNPWELIWVHFNGNLIENYYDLYLNRNGSIFFNSESTPDLTNILLQLIDIATHENAASELLCSHLLNSLITTTLTLTDTHNSNHYKKINQIKKNIDESFQKKLTLDSIAKEFFISKYHMSREFKKNYGITINNYITNKRTTLAKQLLRFTDKSINEISQLCGYHDNSYFNKVFKKVEKLSPSEYRKKWRGDKKSLL